MAAPTTTPIPPTTTIHVPPTTVNTTSIIPNTTAATIATPEPSGLNLSAENILIIAAAVPSIIAFILLITLIVVVACCCRCPERKNREPKEKKKKEPKEKKPSKEKKKKEKPVAIGLETIEEARTRSLREAESKRETLLKQGLVNMGLNVENDVNHDDYYQNTEIIRKHSDPLALDGIDVQGAGWARNSCLSEADDEYINVDVVKDDMKKKDGDSDSAHSYVNVPTDDELQKAGLRAGLKKTGMKLP